MKNTFVIITLIGFLLSSGCSKEQFRDNYTDPSKAQTTSLEKQFAGMLYTNIDYVMPSYQDYFVVMPNFMRWTQTVGFINATQQYVPALGAISDRWSTFYNFLAQYREVQKLYNKMLPSDKADYRIFYITATIYFYYHTQLVVDIHGDIPWSGAGYLTDNRDNYANAVALAKYDKAEDIYTFMLDDLKGFSDELNNLSVKSYISGSVNGFNTQDFINNGSVALWKKFCNSLRLKMLNRVSSVPSFSSRVNTEITSIVSNPGTYPVVDANEDNIQIDVFNKDSDIHSRDFYNGITLWGAGDLAPKAIIDQMLANTDPRIRAIYQPGKNAKGVYFGLDPLTNPSDQTALYNAGVVSIYNWSTITKNQYFPGVLINAAEIAFIKAESYLRAGNDGAAKASYTDGITLSIRNHFNPYCNYGGARPCKMGVSKFFDAGLGTTDFRLVKG